MEMGMWSTLPGRQADLPSLLGLCLLPLLLLLALAEPWAKEKLV
jgi:hypothetical protein